MNPYLIENFAASCKGSFFGFHPWYYYLPVDGNCDVKSFKVLDETTGRSDFLLIGLAVLDDLLIVAGMVTVGFIIYGGIMYVTSQGSPDQTQKAQSTIQNALIGLVVTILAIALIRFLGARLS